MCLPWAQMLPDTLKRKEEKNEKDKARELAGKL
jgi:hypothetical protein